MIQLAVMLAPSNPEIIGNALSGMGFVGASISGLLVAIGALTTAVVFLYRRVNAINEERKEEIRGAQKVAETTNAILTKIAEVNDDRNKATEDLADAIKAQATVFEIVTQRSDFQHAANLEKMKDLREVVGSLSDAVRVSTGVITMARDSSVSVLNGQADVKSKLDTLLSGQSEFKTKIDAITARRR